MDLESKEIWNGNKSLRKGKGRENKEILQRREKNSQGNKKGGRERKK